MPLHIDVRVNERTVRRLHIARMTSNGLQPDSINEYAVIATGPEPVISSPFGRPRSPEPEEWEWELAEIRFTHRYGDDELTCLMKAVEALKAHEAAQAGTPLPL